MYKEYKNLEELEFSEEKPDHHYRTEIPNFIFGLLNPNQLAVYCHIKQIAGDSGRCWMSMKNLAKRIGIGETLLRQCLKELSTPDFFFKGSLIQIIQRKKSDGAKDSNLVKIIDIWRINGNFFRKTGTSPNEGGVPRQTRIGTSPNEDKEEPSQEEPSKEKQYTQSSSSSSIETRVSGGSDDACGADDDPCGAGISFSSDSEKEEGLGNVEVTNTRGEKVSISVSEIFRHFVKKPYDTTTLQEAIKRTRTAQGAINNVLKYIESVCVSIGAQRSSKRETAKTKEVQQKEEVKKVFKEKTTIGAILNKIKEGKNV